MNRSGASGATAEPLSAGKGVSTAGPSSSSRHLRKTHIWPLSAPLISCKTLRGNSNCSAKNCKEQSPRINMDGKKPRFFFFCPCKTECPTHLRKKELFGCSCSAGSLDHRCRLVSGVVPVIAFMRPAAHAPRAKRRSYERREAAKREGAAAQREGSSSTARRGAAERD